jgi:heme/copper-type cytochrome/quinol oxidase subunit 3
MLFEIISAIIVYYCIAILVSIILNNTEPDATDNTFLSLTWPFWLVIWIVLFIPISIVMMLRYPIDLISDINKQNKSELTK